MSLRTLLLDQILKRSFAAMAFPSTHLPHLGFPKILFFSARDYKGPTQRVSETRIVAGKHSYSVYSDAGEPSGFIDSWSTSSVDELVKKFLSTKIEVAAMILASNSFDVSTIELIKTGRFDDFQAEKQRQTSHLESRLMTYMNGESHRVLKALLSIAP